jgi:hypothetical protein
MNSRTCTILHYLVLSYDIQVYNWKYTKHKDYKHFQENILLQHSTFKVIHLITAVCNLIAYSHIEHLSY